MSGMNSEATAEHYRLQKDQVLVERSSPLLAEVIELLSAHLADMRQTSPPESVHALDPRELTADNVRFWVARVGGKVAACGALKILDDKSAELKSMRTSDVARGRGLASALLEQIVSHAKELQLDAVYLETGSHEFFAPARRLYTRHGFAECGPFADYAEDPHSIFMVRKL